MHARKASTLISFTDAGMESEGRAVHPLNVLFSIEVREFGNLMDVSAEQSSKAPSLIAFMEFGKSISESDVHWAKASDPKDETVVGRWTEERAEQLLNV